MFPGNVRKVPTVSNSAASVVSALALVHERFVELATLFRGLPSVSTVKTAVTPRRYESGDRVEYYVDAELKSGNGVGAWLEFGFAAGSWVIESSIRHNTNSGEDELIGLPTRYAVDDGELVRELADASSALARAAADLNLEAL